MIRLSAKGPYGFVARGDPGRWQLREGGSGAPEAVLQSVPFVIGRALDCDLLLPHRPELAKTTSRWHCHIVRERDRFVLGDGSLLPVPETGARKPSIGGTTLNGSRLAAPAPLKDGDVIGVGPWRFGVAGTAEPSVDIDEVLMTMAGVSSRKVDPSDPGLTGGFAQLHGLFRRLGKVSGAEEGLAAVLEFALAKIEPAVVAAILEAQPDGTLSVPVALHREKGRVQDFRFSMGLVQGLPPDRTILLDAGGHGDLTKSQVAQAISSGLVVPLVGPEGRIGFLYLDNRTRGASFTPADMYLAHALASVASLQLSLQRQAFLSRLEQNMRQYFGPDVVRQLVAACREGRPLGLGVKEYDATILFVDLQGFSEFCRGHSPVEVSELLNPYYKLVSECIQEHGGHVDKFLGDGVMGVFGVSPLGDSGPAGPSHALQAARSARQAAVAWAEGSLSNLRMRVSLRAGLDSGRVVAGNIGFSGRMEYSVVGDAVNLASRMEKLARPNASALTDATRRLVASEFPCEDGGLVDVHGFGALRVWHLA